jgi:hypothetical protein
MFRTFIVFSMLLAIKALSMVFYRHDLKWVGDVPDDDPWSDLKLVVFLNHTSLFEPVFTGGVPIRFLWRLARHGVVPAADKTTGRPLVGIVFKFVARNVISITRERDHTWYQVLQTIDPDSMVVIAPEGRMMRANGLDAQGKPMTVRGGIADILQVIPSGRMLIAYSGGLHHVQIPGERPKVFKTVRIRCEDLEIAEYRDEMMKVAGADGYKKAVIADLERRRDFYAPTEEKVARGAA